MIWGKVTSILRRGSAGRDVATLTMGTALAQIITIAATPLLTRLYTPSDFGLLAVFLAVVGVVATLVTLRYESSILVPKRNEESANLVLLSFTLSLVLSTLLAGMATSLPANLQEKFGLGALNKWLPIALLTAGATAILTIMQGWLTRQKEYKKIAWLRVAQSTSIASIAIALGLLQLKNGLLIAQITTSCLLFMAAIWLGRSAINQWNKQELKKTAHKHRNTPIYLLPAALLDTATLQLPVVLIAAWFSAGEAGQFSMAWRLLMMPMTLIGSAIGQVFMQRFSIAIENPIHAKEIIKQTWILLFILGLTPLLAVTFFGEHIFKSILGESWTQSGTIAAILTPMVLAIFISSPTSGAYIILGLHRYSLLFGIAAFVYRPFCLYIGMKFNDLTLGLKLWAIFEIIQIATYQLLVWKNLKARQ